VRGDTAMSPRRMSPHISLQCAGMSLHVPAPKPRRRKEMRLREPREGGHETPDGWRARFEVCQVAPRRLAELRTAQGFGNGGRAGNSLRRRRWRDFIAPREGSMGEPGFAPHPAARSKGGLQEPPLHSIGCLPR